MPEHSSLIVDLASLHPRDTARFMEMRDVHESVTLLMQLPEPTLVKVLNVMEPHYACSIILELDQDRSETLLTEMDPAAVGEILEEMPPETRLSFTTSLGETFITTIEHAQGYPEDTAGGMMDRQVTTLRDDLTVESAIARLRRAPRQRLHYLYAVGEQGRLAGVLPMRELLLARARQPIRELLVTDVTTVPPDASRDRVLQLFEERKLLALPVIDEERHLLGVITTAQAVAAGTQAGMAKMQIAVGAGADESALSTVSEVVKRRLPWLYVNLLTAFAAAGVVGLFESVIAKMTALAVLLPVVSGQGGNSGSQSLAIVMRGLALREILPGMTRRVIIKEVSAGLINGVAIAIVTGLVVWMWSRNFGLGIVIALAMIVNMTAATFAGAVIPLILKKIGKDPAQASAIILTTVTDIIGFAAFLGFAAMMSRFIQ